MSAYMLKFAELARDALIGLRPARAMLDSAAPGALQRAKLAMRLSAKVAELVAAIKPGAHLAAGARPSKDIVLIATRARLAKDVVDLLLEMGVTPAAANEHIQMLTDIAEGRKDSRGLTVLWSLIHQAVEALQESNALTGKTETLAHRAITRWAELEEQTNG